VSSRIDVRLAPSLSAGALASLPWLALLTFTALAGLLTLPALLFCLPLIVAGVIWQARTSGLLRGRRAITGLQVEDDQLFAVTASGTPLAARIAPESRITARLALLKVSTNDTISRSRLVILVDAGPYCCNVRGEDFRRLRAWIRLSGSAATGGNPQRS